LLATRPKLKDSATGPMCNQDICSAECVERAGRSADSANMIAVSQSKSLNIGGFLVAVVIALYRSKYNIADNSARHEGP
jgi:hypothetical protein